MSTLARQQRVLLEALFRRQPLDAMKNIATGHGLTGARGLKVYQANAAALARRALGAAYPVVAQLVGEESFADIAQAHWQTCPPQRGDVAQWGHALPAFLACSESLATEPYLPDVARVEWLLHLAASAPDAAPDLASLALLTDADPAGFTLELCPAAAVLASPYPVGSILLAHLAGEPSLQEAGRRIRAGRAEQALVWREGFRPRVREALPGEADLITALQAGCVLAVALDAAPALDFNQWLPLAVQSGLLSGARPVAQGETL